jgi:glycosyltransferase involved in cell wall biosynthesis
MIHDAQVFITPQSYGRAFRKWYRFALPRIGATAARILTVSEFSKSQLVNFGVAPPDKIQVIHNGVDHMKKIASSRDAVIRFGLKRNEYVVALASTQSHKNIGVLLKAFALPSMSCLKLVLVGHANASKFIAAGLLPCDNTVFAGYLSDGEMRGLMEEAACLALPSTTEGFGLLPVEAMAIGCAAIVAPCGALPEVCGTAVVYVAPDDVEGWGSAIQKFAEDANMRRAMAAKGLEHVKSLTWTRAASSLLNVIYNVAHEN